MAQGRYSFIGAQPSLEVVATQGRVVILDHEAGTRVEREVTNCLTNCLTMMYVG